ncbi:MAG: hypothetical protein HFH67_12610 [Lachnospiraceae bacterium]|nr:hypothetical protein [Lachnospiraceae bacterium]
MVQNSSNCVLPNGSFQGIDIANEGDTGKHAIYIASGNQVNDKELVIARVSYDVSASTLTYKDNVGINLSGNNNELEGIHVINSSTLYIGIAKHNSNGKTNFIYSVPRSSV